jgi:hypothetical protein
MRLRDLFKKNPFQNLIVAGQSTADFPLRGHEDLLDERFREISTAIENPNYPNDAQHTIVFGEWGHGKSHVLRTIEYKINNEFASRAKAVFFEPTESDPKGVFQELCLKLNVKASNPGDFIEEVKQNYPRNLFLLIDETQALVGEKISSLDYDDHLSNYWQLLSELQHAAISKLYGLHVFHGLSANGADAIRRVGKIPAIKMFTANIFSLKSLDEEAQWQMISDHIRKSLGNNNIEPSDLINRGINRCLNELTGGNPRFVLSLMNKIFYKAQCQDLEKIDGTICYQTLCDTPRFDTSGQNFFDRFSINEAIEQLEAGKKFEQKIAEMFQNKIGYILGEWGDIDQVILPDYELNAVVIRRKCDSLKEPIVLFDQLPGQTNFSLSHKFLQLIRVKIQKALTEIDDKDLLLRLQLWPEKLVPSMLTGIQNIMGYNESPGRLRPLQATIPFSIYVTNLGGAHLSQNIKVGFAVFKGDEIPQDVFDKIVKEIEEDRCTIIIIIEHASTCHDQSGSSFKSFRTNYNGNIDIDKRFIFINGTDSSGKVFDEDFFVQLVKIDINENEAKNWYERLQIDQRLKKIEEDCIYCPDLNERTLLEELFKKNRSFNIGEMTSLSDNFNWVRRERLAKLGLYLNKTGNSFTSFALEQIAPLKFILGKLQGVERGLTESEIDSHISTRYIRTGANAAIQEYAKWVLRLLVDHNKVSEVNGLFSYKDLDRELRQLGKDYAQSCQSVKSDISEYERAGIEVRELGEIRDEEIGINQRIEAIMINGEIEVKIEEYKDAINKLSDFAKLLSKIPEKARITLCSQFNETMKKFETIKQCTFWPLEDTDNPYETSYRLGDVKLHLDKLASQIEEEIPQQRRYRQEIMDINNKLEGLDSLLEGEISSGSYEEQELDECIFNIFNAIKDGKSGKITLHFS